MGAIDKTSLGDRRVGELTPDVSGPLVTVARIDPDRAYVGVTELLRARRKHGDKPGSCANVRRLKSSTRPRGCAMEN